MKDTRVLLGVRLHTPTVGGFQIFHVITNLAPATANGLVTEIVFGHGLVLAFVFEKNKKQKIALNTPQSLTVFFSAI
jgi:hypothetical protein